MQNRTIQNLCLKDQRRGRKTKEGDYKYNSSQNHDPANDDPHSLQLSP